MKKALLLLMIAGVLGITSCAKKTCPAYGSAGQVSKVEFRQPV